MHSRKPNHTNMLQCQVSYNISYVKQNRMQYFEGVGSPPRGGGMYVHTSLHPTSHLKHYLSRITNISGVVKYVNILLDTVAPFVVHFQVFLNRVAVTRGA